MKSETIGKLSEALAKAQGAMEFAKKDSMNPHFKNKYADIAAIIDAVRAPLSNNGLSYVQLIEQEGSDQFLVTQLNHISGEWISGRLKLLLPKPDMQGLGSALTYARRYSLSAMMGIAQDDDDGRAACPWRFSEVHMDVIRILISKSGWTFDQIKEYLGKPSAQLTDREFIDLCVKISEPLNLGDFPRE